MADKIIFKKIVLATHNQGKIREFSRLFAPLGVEIIASSTLNLEEPEETGSSFSDNALLKARAACKATDLPALADDSGLAVTALNGAPGIYSARWAEQKDGQKDFIKAMAKVHTELADSSDRSAAFVAVLALVTPEGDEYLFEGRAEGEIIWPPRGDQGFGYDPIFVPHGDNKTFAEMSSQEKQNFSHRAKAFNALQEALFT
jgi:XTP/dITP diphosphohydrolase